MKNRKSCLAFSLWLVAASFAHADDLDRQMHDRYVNKTLVLRGFYAGEHLRYDASGSLVSSNPSSDWTSDGFVLITDIGMKGHDLRIKARRVSAISENKTFSLRIAENENVRPGENKAITVNIDVDLKSHHPTADQAEAAMANIFLSDKDDFVSLIPDYWKPCVPAGLAGKDENCRFNPELMSIPGLSSTVKDESPIDHSPPEQRLAADQVLRVRKGGVSPPKLTLHKEPEFSELARRMKYQGTGTLGLTVNRDGVPTNVHVVNPLGCGLDAQAVRAVEGWRFKPAEKDGQPVAVQIAVEIDFHLY